MGAGRFFPVTIEQWSNARDAKGVQAGWTTFAEDVFASQAPFRYKAEEFSADRETAFSLRLWKLRWVSGLKPLTMRIVWENRYFRIEEVQEIEPFRYMQLLTKEVPAKAAP